MAMAWRVDRGPSPPRIRGRQLQQLRARLFAKQPVCALCHVRPSVVRDHIRNLSDGGRDVESNTQGLCQGCSDAKTAEESRRGIASRGR